MVLLCSVCLISFIYQTRKRSSIEVTLLSDFQTTVSAAVKRTISHLFPIGPHIVQLITESEPGSTFWSLQSASCCCCQSHLPAIWHQCNTAKYMAQCHTVGPVMRVKWDLCFTTLLAFEAVPDLVWVQPSGYWMYSSWNPPPCSLSLKASQIFPSSNKDLLRPYSWIVNALMPSFSLPFEPFILGFDLFSQLLDFFFLLFVQLLFVCVSSSSSLPQNILLPGFKWSLTECPLLLLLSQQGLLLGWHIDPSSDLGSLPQSLGCILKGRKSLGLHVIQRWKCREMLIIVVVVCVLPWVLLHLTSFCFWTLNKILFSTFDPFLMYPQPISVLTDLVCVRVHVNGWMVCRLLAQQIVRSQFSPFLL